jgi:hypothetical protein
MNFNWKTYALVGGGAYLLYYLYNVKKLGDSVSYTPVGVEYIRGTGISDFAIRVKFKLTNPTKTSVKMKSVDGTISVGSDVVGTFKSKPFAINAGENFFDMDFKLVPTSAAIIFFQAIANKKAPQFVVTLNKRLYFITTTETFTL